MITPHPEAGKTLSAVWMNGQGDVTGFGLTPPVEQPDSQAFHFLGFQVISQDVFKGIPSGVSNIFYDIFVKALRDGQKISSYLVEDVVWNETGNEVDYLRAHADLLEKLATHSHYAEPIRSLLDRFSPGWGAVQPRAGVFLHRDSHLTTGDFPPRALISANCRLHPEAQFSKSGFVVLGESCEVREPCLLENVVLATGAITDQKGYLSQTLVTGTSLETQH
jgi:NDP-sugar pyrophosphorylase family protein